MVRTSLDTLSKRGTKGHSGHPHSTAPSRLPSSSTTRSTIRRFHGTSAARRSRFRYTRLALQTSPSRAAQLRNMRCYRMKRPRIRMPLEGKVWRRHRRIWQSPRRLQLVPFSLPNFPHRLSRDPQDSAESRPRPKPCLAQVPQRARRQHDFRHRRGQRFRNGVRRKSYTVPTAGSLICPAPQISTHCLLRPCTNRPCFQLTVR